MKAKLWAAVAVALPLGACATVVEGTRQSITINTQPPGAECHLTRAGKEIGALAQTPGSLQVDKSKNDITVTCTKEGFEPTIVSAPAKFVGTTFGNIILGGVVGAVVDASSGANYTYPTSVDLALTPKAGALPPVAAAPPAPATPSAAAAPAPVQAVAPAPSPAATPAAPTPEPVPAETASAPAAAKKVRMSTPVGR